MVQDNAVVATQNPADAAAEQERRDKALARLLDKAKPEERAVLRAMPKEKLDELCRTLTETEDDEEMLPNGNTRLRNRRL